MLSVDIHASSIPIGQPINGTSVYVLSDQGELVPQCSIGELYIGGAGLARGYLNQPELTAERFIPNPFSDTPDDRLYKTGDLVRYLPDGNLEFIGRIDDQVKIRGFRIELGEIESTLSECEGVTSSLVLSREDEPGHKRLVAYVVVSAIDTIDESVFVSSLRVSLQDTLPDYMMPSAFVLLNKFPLTANGKIDKQALPAPDGSNVLGEYVAPESETEKALVSIWAKLLKLDADSISVKSNFFELGGHSLLAVRLVSEIRTQLHQELSVKVVFESSTIQELAKQIDSGSEVSLRSAVVAVQRSLDTPVITSFAQQRLWFIDQLQGGSAEYNMPAALQVTGDFDVDAAEQAIVRIIRRHDTLRTVFIVEDDKALQVIQSEFEFTLKRYDLTQLEDDEQQVRVMELVTKDSRQVFDLSQDLMVRASYLQLSSRGVLLFNMHHIASDGWSMGVLVKEFVTQYQSIVQGEGDLLPPLEIQYADYAHWQREWLVGEVLDVQLAYWTKNLLDVPVVHSLPLDYSRPAYKQQHGGKVIGTIPALLSKKLQLEANKNEMTLFMLLHASLSLVLSATRTVSRSSMPIGGR
jgi:acyl carrier protein